MAELSARHGDTTIFDAVILKLNGTPLDLTGATVWMTVKEKKGGLLDDTDAIFKWYWVSGGGHLNITVPDPTTGAIVLTLLPADTIDKPVSKKWVYDVQIAFSPILVYTWDDGTFQFYEDVTQRITTP